MLHSDPINNKFKYPIKDLLKVVKENRKKHEDQYKSAMEAYRSRVVDVLRVNLDVAITGRDVDHDIGVIRPRQYLREYDRAIRMFEMTSEKEAELDSRTFAQLVMDEWSWKDDFISSTSAYVGKAGR
jgi:hypothetical protein